jgi:hypothetical protein
MNIFLLTIRLRDKTIVFALDVWPASISRLLETQSLLCQGWNAATNRGVIG